MTGRVLTTDDKTALRAYWDFFLPHRERLFGLVRQRAHGELERIVALRDDDSRLEQNAIIEDDWAPYLASLHKRGEACAAAGVPYTAWFALSSLLRKAHFDVLYANVPELVASSGVIAFGTHLSLDISVQTFGAAFLDAKEEYARRQDQQFRAMFQDSPVPMWTHDVATGRFVAVNAAVARTYGYTEAELLAMKSDDLVLGDAADGSTLRRHRHKDGSTLVVELTSSELRTGGAPLQLVTITDVTEREQARGALRASETKLQHSQKMEAIGRLASGVAHDFNNMLTVVSSYASILEEELDAADVHQRDAREIRLAAERATKLTQQLLTLSRQGGAAPRPVLVDELVQGFRSTLRQLLGSSITLDIQAGRVPPVVVDPGQLEQVVMNLAVNARDAMQGEGRVVIETSIVDLDSDGAAMHGVSPGRFVVLAVTDTGPGIDPDVQKRLFEPFFTTKEPGKGTGLGLSIAHGIVSQAGGAIDVYSELGHGTTFRIRLPARDETVVVSVDEAPSSSPVLRPVTVLFVDPQPEVRALATRVLEPAGCTVLEAASAGQARDLCLKFDGAIDVVVVDIALPDGRGDLAVRLLRELRPDLQVIVMSGYPSGAIGPSGDAPAELLAKPFTPARLRDAIAAVTTTDGSVRPSEPTLQSRVLVVDDDPTLRRMLTRLLKRAAYDVVDVGSGREALAALGAKRCDVVLSDIHMPDGDGLELLRSVRRVDLDIPVILMSGKPDVATAATALEFGAFRYLTKPLETEAVEKVVRQAARAHALARIRREALSITGGRQSGAADRAGLEVRFDQALENLWMAFQPIVEARSGALFGVEALMRSPEPSLPTPPAMIDAAIKLDRLAVLARRTRMLAAVAVGPRPDIPSLFINLHPSDLFDINLLDTSVPLTQIASRVVLEVTERESLVTGVALIERLERLRELGYRIAVDDIGAGYSGLTSFTDLTPEIVKIDMSLVRAIHASTVKQRTVGALCTLCHEMGALVVGEGVETSDERDCLVSLGCDLLQGYLLARPARELPATP